MGACYNIAMDLMLVILLSVVQGITEFLPISSDGHLLVAENCVEGYWIHPPDAMELNIVLHVGTFFSILVIYGRRAIRLLTHDRRVLGLLVVGTLPAVVVGLPLDRWFEDWLENPLLAGCMLPLTGLILIWGSRRPVGNVAYEDLSYRNALIIGLCQATALLPGISRSGTTIVAGLAVGMRRDAAATFSFLLALPAVGGACLLRLIKIAAAGSSTTPAALLITGAAVSFVVGVFALWWLIRWLESGRLHYFAWWCIALGLGMVAWQLAGLSGWKA